MTRGVFARKVIRGLGATVTVHNRRALQAQMQAEGGDVANNPINTTMHMPGSTRFNSADVQNYPTAEIGIQATVKTLKLKGHGYEKIVSLMKANAPATDIVKAVGESDWGTGGGLIFDVLDDIRHSRHPNTLVELEAREIAS